MIHKAITHLGLINILTVLTMLYPTTSEAQVKQQETTHALSLELIIAEFSSLNMVRAPSIFSITIMTGLALISYFVIKKIAMSSLRVFYLAFSFYLS